MSSLQPTKASKLANLLAELNAAKAQVAALQAVLEQPLMCGDASATMGAPVSRAAAKRLIAAMKASQRAAGAEWTEAFRRQLLEAQAAAGKAAAAARLEALGGVRSSMEQLQAQVQQLQSVVTSSQSQVEELKTQMASAQAQVLSLETAAELKRAKASAYWRQRDDERQAAEDSHDATKRQLAGVREECEALQLRLAQAQADEWAALDAVKAKDVSLEQMATAAQQLRAHCEAAAAATADVVYLQRRLDEQAAAHESAMAQASAQREAAIAQAVAEAVAAVNDLEHQMKQRGAEHTAAVAQIHAQCEAALSEAAAAARLEMQRQLRQQSDAHQQAQARHRAAIAAADARLAELQRRLEQQRTAHQSAASQAKAQHAASLHAAAVAAKAELQAAVSAAEVQGAAAVHMVLAAERHEHAAAIGALKAQHVGQMQDADAKHTAAMAALQAAAADAAPQGRTAPPTAAAAVAMTRVQKQAEVVHLRGALGAAQERHDDSLFELVAAQEQRRWCRSIAGPGECRDEDEACMVRSSDVAAVELEVNDLEVQLQGLEEDMKEAAAASEQSPIACCDAQLPAAVRGGDNVRMASDGGTLTGGKRDAPPPVPPAAVDENSAERQQAPAVTVPGPAGPTIQALASHPLMGGLAIDDHLVYLSDDSSEDDEEVLHDSADQEADTRVAKDQLIAALQGYSEADTLYACQTLNVLLDMDIKHLPPKTLGGNRSASAPDPGAPPPDVVAAARENLLAAVRTLGEADAAYAHQSLNVLLEVEMESPEYLALFDRVVAEGAPDSCDDDAQLALAGPVKQYGRLSGHKGARPPGRDLMRLSEARACAQSLSGGNASARPRVRGPRRR